MKNYLLTLKEIFNKKENSIDIANKLELQFSIHDFKKIPSEIGLL